MGPVAIKILEGQSAQAPPRQVEGLDGYTCQLCVRNRKNKILPRKGIQLFIHQGSERRVYWSYPFKSQIEYFSVQKVEETLSHRLFT